LLYLQELLHEENFVSYILVCRFRDAVSRQRSWKNENQQLLSPSRQCSNKPVGFHQGFL